MALAEFVKAWSLFSQLLYAVVLANGTAPPVFAAISTAETIPPLLSLAPGDGLGLLALSVAVCCSLLYLLLHQRLAASEKRFRSVWETSRDAMYLTNREGTIVAVNPAFSALAEAPEQELVGKSFTIHEQPGQESDALRKYQQSFSARAASAPLFTTKRFKDGRMVDLEIVTSFMETEKETLQLWILRDLTQRLRTVEELRQAKEFSENLIHTANILIVGLTADGKIQVLNETAQHVLGWTQKEALGRDWIPNFIPAAEQARLQQVFAAVKSGGERLVENTVLTRAGEQRIISWRNNEIFQDGKVVGTLSFGIDVTEQRRAEARQKELERKLLESQKFESLGAMAGGIAHDFNNMLAIIIGNASLAGVQIEPSSPASSMLATIEKTAARAADLCQQMLSYAGQSQLSISVLDLNTLVQDSTGLLESSISKKAKLVVDFGVDLPAVEGDRAQLSQVLLNLVINASEALENREGVIRIKTGQVEQGETEIYFAHGSAKEPRRGNYLFLEVSDNGCGMSEETKARIFDPFFSTKFAGRGLGLAAVLGIVRAHRGALRVSSERGKGSTFRVLLPASQKPLDSSPSLPEMDSNWRGSGTILVVDDDLLVREITCEMLRGYGFEVLDASDGAEGVSVYAQNPGRIDAVLLDMTMPRLNGAEAFLKIRELNPEARIILMSGYTEPVAEAELRKAGWNGFIHKPFKPAQIGAMLKAVLGL